MAETAAILAPEKTVLLPEIEAGCPMADMINGRELRAWKDSHPGLKVVCYVNTSAEVKAESDICCTSAQRPGRRPTRWASRKPSSSPTGTWPPTSPGRRAVELIAWDGYCHVHNRFTPQDVRDARALHPGAEVWVHPECPLEVIDLADKVLSTGKMVLEARTTKRPEIVIGTEKGILYRLAKENPAATASSRPKTSALCAHMKMTTLRQGPAGPRDGYLPGRRPPGYRRPGPGRHRGHAQDI